MHATVKPSPASRSPAGGSGATLALKLAWRDLRGGLRGFGVFIACLALGVMAIAAVASASRRSLTSREMPAIHSRPPLTISCTSTPRSQAWGF